MNIYLQLGDKCRHDLFVSRALELGATITLPFPAADCSPAAREIAFSLPGTDTRKLEVGGSVSVGSRDNFASPVYPETPQQWNDVLTAFATARTDYAEKAAAFQAQRRAEEAARLQSALTEWKNTDKADIIFARSLFSASTELKADPAYGYLIGQVDETNRGITAFNEALSARKEANAKAKAEAEAEEARQSKAARQAWIAEFGSLFLRDAVDDGYNCQKRYVTERAQKELPGFEVDFEGGSDYKDRACPSEKGFAEARAVNAALTALYGDDAVHAGMNAPYCRVVWLTATVGMEGWLDKDDQREALVTGNYLNKYRLVK